MPISICIGKIPLKYINRFPKRLYANVFGIYLTFFLNFAFWILKIILKQFNKRRFTKYQTFERKWSNVFNKEVIHFQVLQFFGLAYLLIVTPLGIRFNGLHPSEAETFPNYFFFFLENNVSSPVFIVFVISLLLRKSEKLRTDVWHELKNMFNVY